MLARASLALVVCAAVLGCGSKPRDASPPPDEPAAAPPAAAATVAPTPPPSVTRADDEWPQAPTRVVTDRIGAVAFSLRLPTELQSHPDDRTERSRGWEVPGWPLTQPRFEITLRDEPAIATLAAGREAYADDDDRVMSAELVDGRFAIALTSGPDTRPADAFVSAFVVIPAGAASLECFATHGGTHLTRPEVIGPWLVAACSTLAVTAGG